MAKPFDATLNSLIDAHPGDWAAFLAARAGTPPGPAAPLDTDLSATLQADRLFRVDGPRPAVLHLELEATSRLGLPGQLLRSNVAAHAAVGLPVHSVLVLLRPKANASDLTGEHTLTGADGAAYLWFRYRVVRLWAEPVEGLLAAGPGLAPLALHTDEAATDLPAAFRRTHERLRAAGVPGRVEAELLGATFVLCGLRYERSRVQELYMSVSRLLEDSTTYQYLVEKGEAEGRRRGLAEGRVEGELEAARRLVLRLGERRFGPPPAAVAAAVRAVADPAQLDRLAERVLDAAGWDDLLTR